MAKRKHKCKFTPVLTEKIDPNMPRNFMGYDTLSLSRCKCGTWSTHVFHAYHEIEFATVPEGLTTF